jgi:hypothetical protein
MKNWSHHAGLGFIALSALAIWTLGCNNSPSTTPADSPQSSGAASTDHSHEGHEHGDHEHAGQESDAAEIAEQLAKLSPEDRAAAEKQKVCPVTGEPLGSMGVPRKVAVNDREVFICCEGCEEELKADPEKYLAKLPE